MKKEALTYALAIVAIAVSGFFGWNAKEKYVEKTKDRIILEGENKTLSANIEREEGNKETATQAKELALEEKSTANAQLDSAKGKGTELATTLESVSSNLEVAAAEKKKIDASMEALRGKFPGIELEEVPRVVKDMEANQKRLSVKRRMQVSSRNALRKILRKISLKAVGSLKRSIRVLSVSKGILSKRRSLQLTMTGIS